MHKLSIIIPCFNEARTIKEVVEKVATASLPPGFEREILVVDDGSGEETRSVLHDMVGAHVIYRPHNSGKGAAVKDGLRAASGDLIIIQDADLELDPSQYGELLAPIMENRAEAVFGYRVLASSHGSYNPLLFWGGKGISMLYNAAFFKNFRDIPCCYKVFPSRCVPALVSAPSEDFVFDAVEMTHVISRECSVEQVPVVYHPRSRAQGKKIRAKHGLYSAAAIVFLRLGLHRGPVAHEVNRMVRYIATGLISVAVNVATLYALAELGGFWYLSSSAAAFVTSYFANFFLHKYWTFKSLRFASIARELPLHLGLALFNLMLNTALVYTLVEYMGIWYLLAQVIAAGVIAFESFLLLSRVIFIDKRMLN